MSFPHCTGGQRNLNKLPLPSTHTHTVEHYKKKQSRYIDEECLPNEMRVGSAGKAHDLATRAMHTLRVGAAMDTIHYVVLVWGFIQ